MMHEIRPSKLIPDHTAPATSIVYAMFADSGYATLTLWPPAAVEQKVVVFAADCPWQFLQI